MGILYDEKMESCQEKSYEGDLFGNFLNGKILYAYFKPSNIFKRHFKIEKLLLCLF